LGWKLYWHLAVQLQLKRNHPAVVGLVLADKSLAAQTLEGILHIGSYPAPLWTACTACI